MFSKKLLGALTVIAAMTAVPGSAAAGGSDADPVRPDIDGTGILATAEPSGAAVKSGPNALGTRAGGEVVGSFAIPAELTSPRSAGVPTAPNDARTAAVKDGTANTIVFAERVATPAGFAVDIGTSENFAGDGPGAAHSVTRASARSDSDVHASQVSPAFSGDAYTNEMGIKGAGAHIQPRGKGNTPYAVPEIGHEVLSFQSHTQPHADGIRALGLRACRGSARSVGPRGPGGVRASAVRCARWPWSGRSARARARAVA